MPAMSISAKAAARKACLRRSARSARPVISAWRLRVASGQRVGVDAGANEVADQIDRVTLAVERVAPQIEIGGDVGIFREQAFADRADEGGGLCLLVRREGGRWWGDAGLAHGGASPERAEVYPARSQCGACCVDTLACRDETARSIGYEATGLSKSDFTAKPLAAFGISNRYKSLEDRSGSQAPCAAVPVVRSELAVLLRRVCRRGEGVVFSPPRRCRHEAESAFGGHSGSQSKRRWITTRTRSLDTATSNRPAVSSRRTSQNAAMARLSASAEAVSRGSEFLRTRAAR
jgi:hypothetical protein